MARRDHEREARSESLTGLLDRQGETFDFTNLDFSQTHFLPQILENPVWVDISTGKDVQRDESQIGVAVSGYVALVEHTDRGESRWRVLAKSVAELRNDVRSRPVRRACHRLEKSFVVKTDGLRDSAAVDEQMPSFVHSGTP